jgi:hypothetical protein
MPGARSAGAAACPRMGRQVVPRKGCLPGAERAGNDTTARDAGKPGYPVPHAAQRAGNDTTARDAGKPGNPVRVR